MPSKIYKSYLDIIRKNRPAGIQRWAAVLDVLGDDADEATKTIFAYVEHLEAMLASAEKEIAWLKRER